jgi:amino acid adenylation domain-containing protein
MMLRHRIKDQILHHADNVAVRAVGSSLTYAELGRYADRVARVIRQAAIQMDSFGPNVGLLFEQGVDSIAAVAGAVLSGYAYVPIHANLPLDRIEYMLSHAQVKLIITSSAHAALAEKIRARNTVEVAYCGHADFLPVELAPLPPSSPPRHLYLMYTSGSTGLPKAVEQTGANVAYFADGLRERVGLNASDRLVMFAHFAFDAAVVDIFSALLAGAAIHPYALASPSGFTALPDYLVSERITIWHSVPSLFRLFTISLAEDRTFPDVRVVLLGGEPVRAADVAESRKRFPNATFGAIYGQTESSISSLWFAPPAASADGRVSLGEPLPGTHLQVAGDDGELVEPLGVGQVVVVSDHLASGYWGEPELTRDAFSEDPTAGRLYWTGDLGRLLPDGRIEFAGRRDHQVKLRGMRIELEEIEKRLCGHPSVAAAVVACTYEGAEPVSLVCYWEPRPGGRPGEKELRHYLARFLPDYMVPRIFLEVGAWPQNANGKIDRRALPSIPVVTAPTPTASEVEERVLEIWTRVLGRPVGVNANFFDVGGNSLKLLQVQSLYAESTGTVVPLARLFEFPTIRGFATFVDPGSRKGGARESKAPGMSNRLQARQKRLRRE